MKKILLILILTLATTMALESNVTARLKDISRLESMRDNQLIGYGLVVGLAGTGDGSGTQATLQGISNMLSNFGVQIDASKVNGNNVAAVMVTAKLKPFNMPGDQIDVIISSIGKAKSLRGGILLLTPLKAANGDVYAVAQGAVSIAGYAVSSKGSSAAKNHATVGRIPNGAIVEQGVVTKLAVNDKLAWIVNYEDFSTMENIKRVLTTEFPELEVEVVNPSKFTVAVPEAYKNNVNGLIAKINNISIDTDSVAKIIINERTGSIVMGGPIKISPVVVAHENLNISVKSNDQVYQPNALGNGETTLVKGSIVTVEKSDKTAQFKTIKSENNSIEEVVAMMNNIGVTPSDMIAILQAMKEAGAIKAQLEII